MLLYSTILDISPALTKDNFIQLVIDWNQNDQHEENIIRDLRGMASGTSASAATVSGST